MSAHNECRQRWQASGEVEVAPRACSAVCASKNPVRVESRLNQIRAGPGTRGEERR